MRTRCRVAIAEEVLGDGNWDLVVKDADRQRKNLESARRALEVCRIACKHDAKAAVRRKRRRQINAVS